MQRVDTGGWTGSEKATDNLLISALYLFESIGRGIATPYLNRSETAYGERCTDQQSEECARQHGARL